MHLKGNHYCSPFEYDSKGLMLVLNFNDIMLNTAQDIVDKTLCFVKESLYCKDCYYVSFNSNGRMRKPRNIEFSLKESDLSYSVIGMILPDKNLRQSIMEKPSRFHYYNYNSKDFYDFLKNDRKIKNNRENCVDFEIEFNKSGWSEIFSFEVKIKVSCYSLNYIYDEITELYKNIIRSFSKSHNLFAGYIDFGDMTEGSLVYEYCYYHMLDRIETENLFKSFRSFSWGGYLSNEYLKENRDVTDIIKSNINYEVLSDGLLYFADCKIEKYDWLEQRKQYRLFKGFLTKSFGDNLIDNLIILDYKPFDDEVYLFEDHSSPYVIYSNGLSLFEIKTIFDNEDERFPKGELLDVTKYI